MSEGEDERERCRMERCRKISAEFNMLHGTLFRRNFEKIRIANEAKEAQNKLQSLYDYNDQDPIPDGLLEQEEQDDNNIIVGVEVRIGNLHVKQLNQGVVRGFTSNGFA